IPHIPALLAVRVVAELVSNEERADPIVERETVRELPLDERLWRQRPAERERRLVVLVAAAKHPVTELDEVPGRKEIDQYVRNRRAPAAPARRRGQTRPPRDHSYSQRESSGSAQPYGMPKRAGIHLFQKRQPRDRRADDISGVRDRGSEDQQ